MTSSGERARGRAFESRQERFIRFKKFLFSLKRMLENLCYMDVHGRIELPEKCREAYKGLFILSTNRWNIEGRSLASYSRKEFKEMQDSVEQARIAPSKERKFTRDFGAYSKECRIGSRNGIYISDAQRRYLGFEPGEGSMFEVMMVGNRIAFYPFFWV